ncbi:hypothetical protein KZZ04_20375, partial [Pseudoalteromonas sp. CR1]|nr:hypothetical protein [Pseudoalteromonas sp. CR1]
QPTVQWQNQRVPLAMTGMNSQATSSTFWANTNGATQGVIFQSIAVPGAAITDKSLAFSAAFKKRFGSDPSYAGYMAYDQVY